MVVYFGGRCMLGMSEISGGAKKTQSGTNTNVQIPMLPDVAQRFASEQNIEHANERAVEIARARKSFENIRRFYQLCKIRPFTEKTTSLVNFTQKKEAVFSPGEIELLFTNVSGVVKIKENIIGGRAQKGNKDAPILVCIPQI